MASLARYKSPTLCIKLRCPTRDQIIHNDYIAVAFVTNRQQQFTPAAISEKYFLPITKRDAERGCSVREPYQLVALHVTATIHRHSALIRIDDYPTDDALEPAGIALRRVAVR